DAIKTVAEIKRACAERVVRSAGHVARQVRLALQHLRGRTPVRPFPLGGDRLRARPAEAVAADAYAVAHGGAVPLHEIEEALLGIDDDRARLLVAVIGHALRQELRID